VGIKAVALSDMLTAFGRIQAVRSSLSQLILFKHSFANRKSAVYLPEQQ
jgi:hypothetical protein